MTSLTLKPRIPAPERILAMGGPGAGKSTGILHIASRIPDATFHVMDTDFAFERMLSGQYANLHHANGGNIHVYPTVEWGDYTEHLGKIQTTMTASDWLIVDMISPAWDSVQDFFSEQVFGKSVDQFFFEARAAAKKGSAFDGRKDWTVINKLYKKWITDLILKTPGHVYCTASVSAVSEDDDKGVKQLFGGYGVKPNGQKHNGHIFHTVLLLSKGRVGEFKMTTIKDRERAEVEAQPVTDFSRDYLQKIAGWTPRPINA